MSVRRRIFISILLVFILIVSQLVYTAISIHNYGNLDNKQKSDCIIVLGAAVSPDTVSPVYRERINHAIQLYNSGYADYIITTGGVSGGNDKSDAAIAKKYAVSQGVPFDAVLTEGKSSITEENIKYSKEIMDEKGFDTAIIVSDPLHMKRAITIADNEGINACSSPTPTTMYRSIKTKVPFLIREEFFYIGYKFVNFFRK